MCLVCSLCADHPHFHTHRLLIVHVLRGWPACRWVRRCLLLVSPGKPASSHSLTWRTWWWWECQTQRAWWHSWPPSTSTSSFPQRTPHQAPPEREASYHLLTLPPLLSSSRYFVNDGSVSLRPSQMCSLLCSCPRWTCLCVCGLGDVCVCVCSGDVVSENVWLMPNL